MSYKAIIVHADDSLRFNQRLDVAIQLALGFGAELVGMYVVPTAEMTPSVAALLPSEVVSRYLRATGAAQHQAESVFRNATRTAGLTSIDWRAPAGAAIEAAVAHARCTDMVIVGQTKRDDVDAVFTSELTTSVMLSTGRPTLIVPYIGSPPAVGENVLVAWDGGREAARAIADALPILARARQVVVTSINEDPEHPVLDAPTQSRLVAYLRCHHIDAKVNHYSGDNGDVGEWMLSQAADLGTDLIVMGAYGHARLREMVLGGATRSILETMTVPVLMSH